VSLALIDFGAGNLGSVHNALLAAGAQNVSVTADPGLVASADRIVLPGVGAYGACAAALRGIPGMVEALETRVRQQGAPFLGICVGMQLMGRTGEEMGVHQGLGWLDGTVRRMPDDMHAKIPHMGWNDVVPSPGPAADHTIVTPGEAYFLHSYAYDGMDVIATTRHGGAVTAAIGRDNLLGVQFHPEKSQRYGLDLLARFLTWRP
jgi:glutamine amidotransferase